ncbi:MAG TPA: extracellular solute-binding protein [Alphaproteobacteria bacterium]|nr:extracellular solute-binding protein [Alphaproteobacteria bacterium]
MFFFLKRYAKPHPPTPNPSHEGRGTSLSCLAGRRDNILKFAAFLLFVVLFPFPAHAQEAQYGIALHGAPKYPADFTHFDYVNPDAPKGGTLRMWSMGTFSTLNPFTLLGGGSDGADGLGLTFETLMTGSADEPFSEYGEVAQSVTVAPDRSWVEYTLRPEARFSDGSKITPADVIFSFNILREKGHPSYRSYYKDVVKAEQVGPDSVKFTFRDGKNTEMPLIMGQLPVLSKKFWQSKDFGASTLKPILGSGPYKIESIDPGRSITYVRVKNWWAKDLPVNKGRFNFDHIRFDYYRDSTVALQAFFAGRYDFRLENVAKDWALAYKDIPAVKNGLIKRQKIRNELPQGMQAFIFNIRRPLFRDPRVREALGYTFDFQWSNKNLAYGAYKRLNSYFANSELAATGLPSPAELKLLDPWRGKIPGEVFTKAFTSPVSDGSGEDRANLEKAAALLKEAGWAIKNGVLTNAEGQPFRFEIIDDEPMFERWILPWIRNMQRLGIEATYRTVDTSQMQRRMDNFNFDMTVAVYPQSISPGNEERDYFGSSKADQKGSRNLIGIKNPAVDAMISAVVHAKSREDLVTACRALDRILLWNYYVVPNWYIDSFRIAYWDKFGQPKIAPKYGLAVTDSWWIDPAKAGRILQAQGRN